METSSRGLRASRWWRHEFRLIVAIAIVVCITTLVDARHNYWHNPWQSLVNITRQTSLLGIFALGAAVVIIAGGIDLSSGSVIAFSGSMCATILLQIAPDSILRGQPLGVDDIGIAIAGTLLVGFLIGSLHAWLITIVGLPPFVATLATLVGLRSFARAIIGSVTGGTAAGGGSTQIQLFDSGFRYLATSVWIPAVTFLVLAALLWLMLSKTVTGRHLYAMGGNEQAARLSGINTVRLKWLAYYISAMLASIASIFYIGDQSMANPQQLGRGYELNGIAAAVVGGCSLQGGIGTVPGTVLGALFLQTVIDGVAKIIKSGADVYEGLIVGVVVVFAVAFTQTRTTDRPANFFRGALGLVAVLNLTLIAAALAALFGPALLQGSGDQSRMLGNLTARHLSGLAAFATIAVLMLARFDMSRRKRQALIAAVLALIVGAAFVLNSMVPAVPGN